MWIYSAENYVNVLKFQENNDFLCAAIAADAELVLLFVCCFFVNFVLIVIFNFNLLFFFVYSQSSVHCQINLNL